MTLNILAKYEMILHLVIHLRIIHHQHYHARPSHSSSAGPSRKRSRSPTTLVPLSSPVPGALSFVCVDLLPPHKRIRSSDSTTNLEDCSDEITKSDLYLERLVKAALEDVEDEYEGMRSYSVAHEIIRRHVQRFHDHTVEDPSSTSSVLLRVIQRIKVYRIISACRRVVMRQRRNNIEHVLERLRLSSLDCSMIVLVLIRMAEALEARDAARNLESPSGRVEMNREAKMAIIKEVGKESECNNIQGLPEVPTIQLQRVEVFVGLTRWFEKIETVYHISNCPQKNQVKYATCTLLDNALTWWNTHKRTIGIEAEYSMTWTELMKLMTEKFQELVLLCTRMVPNEEDKVKRIIGEIEGICKNVLKTKNVLTINRVIIVATSAFKRQNVGGQNVTRAYTAGNNEKKGPGHYRKDFPKLRNQNRRNKTGNKTVNNEATTKAYAIRGGGANLDSNVFTLCSFSITILCFYVIHSGATGVSVSSTISALLDVLHPSTLDTSLF
ncbi:hypothetical protein Tco_0536725 [Tanacetum coccineum]